MSANTTLPKPTYAAALQMENAPTMPNHNAVAAHPGFTPPAGALGSHPSTVNHDPPQCSPHNPHLSDTDQDMSGNSTATTQSAKGCLHPSLAPAHHDLPVGHMVPQIVIRDGLDDINTSIHAQSTSPQLHDPHTQAQPSNNYTTPTGGPTDTFSPFQMAHQKYGERLKTIWNDFKDEIISRTEMESLFTKAEYKFREDSYQVRVDLTNYPLSPQTITQALFRQLGYAPVQMPLYSQKLLTIYPRNQEDAISLTTHGINIPARDKFAAVHLPAIQALRPRTTLFIETYLPPSAVTEFLNIFYDQMVSVEHIEPWTNKIWVPTPGEKKGFIYHLCLGYRVILSDLVTLDSDYFIIHNHQCFVRNATACSHCRTTRHATENCPTITTSLNNNKHLYNMKNYEKSAGNDDFILASGKKTIKNPKNHKKSPPMHDIRPATLAKAAESAGSTLSIRQLNRIRDNERRKKEQLKRLQEETDRITQEKEDTIVLEQVLQAKHDNSDNMSSEEDDSYIPSSTEASSSSLSDEDDMEIGEELFESTPPSPSLDPHPTPSPQTPSHKRLAVGDLDSADTAKYPRSNTPLPLNSHHSFTPLNVANATGHHLTLTPSAPNEGVHHEQC